MKDYKLSEIKSICITNLQVCEYCPIQELCCRDLSELTPDQWDIEEVNVNEE